MAIEANLDISPEERKTLISLLDRYIPNTTVWAFGSRAKWQARVNSDLDLVAFAEADQEGNISLLKEAFEESSLPFKVDFLVWDKIPKSFQENIQTQYVELISENENKKGWIDTTVGKYCPFVYGKSLPQHQRVKGGIPVFGSNGCVDFHNESHVKTHGLIIGRKGSVGEVHLSEVPFWPIDTSFYVTKDSLEELYFAYYLLKSLGLNKMNSDSAVPGLNRDNAHALKIKIPKLEEDRKKLGKWITEFDKKIKLNNQINQTLEAMAQAIFKSWFVDFEPVKAKMAVLQAGGSQAEAELAAMMAISGKTAEQLSTMRTTQLEAYQQLTQTAALFPAAMQDSELGEIPEGWSAIRVEDVAEKIGMGPFGSNIKVSTFVEDGVPVISGQHLKETLVTDSENNYITEAHAEKLKNSLVYPEDVIFTHAGNIGQVSLIPLNSKYEKYIISQRQFYLRVNRKKSSPYLLTYFFRSSEGQHKLLANASQVGVPSIARPSTHLKSIELVHPSLELATSFELIVSSLLKDIVGNRQSTASLIDLRDSLLPKLLSGEIDLSHLEETAA